METTQEIFTFVAKHLLKQGEKSRGDADCCHEEICMYRGPHGKSCAVGCLIKDEYYRASFEGAAADTREIRDALDASGVDPSTRNMSLLSALQSIHDDDEPNQWDRSLRVLAEKYNLKVEF